MKIDNEQLIPAARNEGIVVQELSGEVLVYDRVRNKAHCLNSTAALVWQYCDGTSSVSQLARAIEGKINAPVDENVIWLGIEQLSKAHLLRDRATLPEHTSELTRRDVVKRLGLSAVVALPLVTSIVAPKAVMAATCLPTGASCTTGIQCCSLVCNASNMCA